MSYIIEYILVWAQPAGIFWTESGWEIPTKRDWWSILNQFVKPMLSPCSSDANSRPHILPCSHTPMVGNCTLLRCTTFVCSSIPLQLQSSRQMVDKWVPGRLSTITKSLRCPKSENLEEARIYRNHLRTTWCFIMFLPFLNESMIILIRNISRTNLWNDFNINYYPLLSTAIHCYPLHSTSIPSMISIQDAHGLIDPIPLGHLAPSVPSRPSRVSPNGPDVGSATSDRASKVEPCTVVEHVSRFKLFTGITWGHGYIWHGRDFMMMKQKSIS